MLSDIVAVKFVDGVKYKARIQQCEQSAYIAVWGNGNDVDATIQVHDALVVMVAVGRGLPVEVPDHVLPVLQEAAAIFAVSVEHKAEAPWGYRDLAS